MTSIKTPKKLIEVALPLDDINEASAYEKLPGIGPHPRGLHQWWARRPLAVARAVLFAQLVNDPGYERNIKRGVNKEAAQRERERLFNILRRLVQWENSDNEELIREAREEILKSWRETCELNKGLPGFDPNVLPGFHDPFAGGGAIPLEAQRLGLEAYASDLNPVPVLINKAMIEIPPNFSGLPPVHPEADVSLVTTERVWNGTLGLADDVRYYGEWIRNEAYKKIGHLYPQVDLPEEYGGSKATVVAWIWARTVKSPNPAFSHVEVPLISTYYLSTKRGKEVYFEPVIQGDKYHFEIRTGKPLNGDAVKQGTKLSRGANFKCIISGTPISSDYIKQEGIAGRMGLRLLAVYVEGKHGRVFVPPSPEMETIDNSLQPEWLPDIEIPEDRRNMFTPLYGLTHLHHLFTYRQLIAHSTFSDLILRARDKVFEDAIAAGREDNELALHAGGTGARAYADAVAVYLAFAVSRSVDFNNSLTVWAPSNEKIMHLFNKQSIPMVWDFGEANIFGQVVGGWSTLIDYISKCIEKVPAVGIGHSLQLDAAARGISNVIVSTDPPYYDNVAYAVLSDFFYVWLRRSLKGIFPELLATLAVPKDEELVATPYRHGGKEAAELFFINGMTKAIKNIVGNSHPAFPITIYYAFKQSETKDGGTISVGWVTFLEAVLNSGLTITGTWPMRSEQATRMAAMDNNSLASSIVLVCRPRSDSAEVTTRRAFIRELNEVLPEALDSMIGGTLDSSPIAAVDLQQAAIGPGMAVFSTYSSVLEADGTPMTVRTALQLINRVVDAYLNASDGELDSDTLFCLNWFDQYGWNTSEYGQAEVLATAKGTTVDGLRDAGVVSAAQGKVRLLKWQEYRNGWRPEGDSRTPVWEALHHIIRTFQQDGEQPAGDLVAGMPERQEQIRSLAYRLYTLCERKGWADDARAYNELISSWDAIDAFAQKAGPYVSQSQLF